MTDPTESRQSEQSVARTNWPWWGRAAFRFAFIYWLLYILPYPGGVSLFDLLPWGTARIESWVVWPMTTLIKVGRRTRFSPDRRGCYDSSHRVGRYGACVCWGRLYGNYGARGRSCVERDR